jgi:hypothetical protein
MSEFNKLGHALALKASINALISNTIAVDIDGVTWHDINGKEDGVALGALYKDELRYLRLYGVGVIHWHPVKPNLFRIVEVTA